MSTAHTSAVRISVSALAAILAMCLACAIAHAVPESKEVLIEKLSSPHQKVRVFAARDLQDMADVKAAVPGLVKMLDDRTPLVWVSESSSHGQNAEEFDSATSGEPSTSPATEAAVALGRIGDHRATKPLSELFRTGVSYERIAALRALATIEGNKSFVVLTEGLHDSTSEVASEARSSMHDVMVEDATEHPLDLSATRRMLSLLENRRADIRASAAKVLGDLHEPLAIPRLSELAQESYPFEVADAATGALTRIREFHNPPLPWVSVILGTAGLLFGIWGIGAITYRTVRRIEEFEYATFWVILVFAVIVYYGSGGIHRFNDCRVLRNTYRQHDVGALVKKAYSSDTSYPGDNPAACILAEIGDEQVIKVLANDARGTDRHKRTIAQWVLARVIAKNEESQSEHMANSRDPEVKKTIAWLLKEMDDSRRR